MSDGLISTRSAEEALVSSARSGRVRYEQVTAVARRSTALAFASLAAALVVISTFWSCGKHAYLLAFFSALVLAHSVAVTVSIRWLAAGPRRTSQRHLNARIALIGAIALVWATVPANLMPLATAQQTQFLVYIFSAFVSLSFLLAPILPAALTLAVLAALGILASLPAADPAIALPQALLLTVILMMNCAVVLVEHRTFIRRILNELTLTEQHDIIGMLLKNFEDSASDWLWEVDAGFRFSRVSDRLAAVLASSKEALFGQDVRTLMLPIEADAAGPYQDLERLLACLTAHEPFRDFQIPLLIDGGTRWVSITGKPILDDQGRFQGYRGVGSDVTAAYRSNERIAHLAHHDSMTDLPNRALFYDALERVCGGGAPFALLCLDLDGFKAVNDTLGHAMGDALLVAVAGRLRGGLRDGDMVARLGGDEFAVLLSGADATTASKLAKRLIDCVGEPYQIGSVPVSIGVSIGIALSDGGVESAADLVQGADLALYKSKFDGRGRSNFFETAMAKRAQSRHALQSDLSRAIARNELTLDFQPILDITSGTIIAAEALARWHHPERGRVPPADFIPIAEESGLIVPLGRWVLREACQQAAAWAGEARVAVNLSPLQFRDAGLLAMIDEVLAATGLAPSRLELEITETVFLDAADRTIACLQALRSRGIHIALDDFGTGYSSLSYLRSFPFDKVKIDQSFIRDLSVDPDAIAIVHAIVGMASSLGMHTTGEGVETQAQARMLRQTGCSQVQGYLFGRPCAADVIAGLMSDNDGTRQTILDAVVQMAEPL